MTVDVKTPDTILHRTLNRSWFDRLTTNGSVTPPFVLSLSKDAMKTLEMSSCNLL